MSHSGLNAVFVTAHEFGVQALEGLVSSPPFLDGALTIPLIVGLDTSLQGQTVGYMSPEHIAHEIGATFLSVRDGSLVSIASELERVAPRYLLVIGWSRLVPPPILSIPTGAQSAGDDESPPSWCIGMHPTRLPEGRGRAPIPWTILKELTKTALSVFFLEKGADTGPLIMQYEISVSPRETSTSLFRRFSRLHFEAGMELASLMSVGSIPVQPQSSRGVSSWPKRHPEMGRISESMTLGDVDRLVRAQSAPYPPATVIHEGRLYEVIAVAQRPTDDGDHIWIPFSCVDKRVFLRVACGPGS